MLFEIRDSPIEGLGGFAMVGIPPGTRISEYRGEKISKRESLRRCRESNHCIFALDDEYDLDGNVGENPARYFNHSCAPNAQAELVEGRVWIVAELPIHPGEEITFDYGYDLESFREHRCRCGSADCVGYIVARQYHAHLRHTAQGLGAPGAN